ncbi:MAG: DUF1826 domain-containing protein [Bacteroidota bacterium]
MIQTKHPFANAAIGSDSNVLEDIHIKSKNIAVLQRDIVALRADLNQAMKQPIEFKASGTEEDILTLLSDYFDKVIPECKALLNDISELLKLFNKTTQASSFRLLLATIDTNMCRKFHTDINDLRLLCTYVGPGTLWLPDEAIDNDALKAGKKNQEFIKDETKIQQAGTGDAVILKGALYPEANPILHRSPPIVENGEVRLLLRIDTNEFLKFLKQD